MDSRFQVKVISQTSSPQQLVWLAMHQDYCEDYVGDRMHLAPPEEKAGELIVKNLLSANRGHYGCYSEDTEVFTSQGWVNWSLITEHHWLAAVQTDNSFCFEQPSALQKWRLENEPMVFLDSRRISYALTPDHRVYVGGDKSAFKIKTALECVTQKVKRFSLAASLSQEQRTTVENPWNIDKITFARMVGFFVGDGSTESSNCIRFNCRLPKKLNFLREIGATVREKTASSYIAEGIGDWFRENCYLGGEKRLPDVFLTSSIEESQALIEGLKASDGTGNFKNGAFSYDTTSVLLLEQLQQLAVINGYIPNVFTNNPSRSPNHKDGYRITFGKEVTCILDSRVNYRETVEPYTGYVYCATVSTGLLLVRHKGKQFVSGNCLEYPAITFAVGYFPHSVMQQARTHRVGVSFDCQSMRFTGKRVADAYTNGGDFEDLFYLRPPGVYLNRQGKKHEYTLSDREEDKQIVEATLKHYTRRYQEGMAEEQARGIISFDFRQHFVVGFNARSLMHFLDLRAKKDAQWEIQCLCELMFPLFASWMPHVANWYQDNRWAKAKLAP